MTLAYAHKHDQNLRLVMQKCCSQAKTTYIGLLTNIELGRKLCLEKNEQINRWMDGFGDEQLDEVRDE